MSFVYFFSIASGALCGFVYAIFFKKANSVIFFNNSSYPEHKVKPGRQILFSIIFFIIRYLLLAATIFFLVYILHVRPIFFLVTFLVFFLGATLLYKG